MIQAQATAYDAMGRIVAYAMGMATRTGSAKFAAMQGLRTRLAGSPALSVKVRRTDVVVL